MMMVIIYGILTDLKTFTFSSNSAMQYFSVIVSPFIHLFVYMLLKLFMLDRHCSTEGKATTYNTNISSGCRFQCQLFHFWEQLMTWEMQQMLMALAL